MYYVNLVIKKNFTHLDGTTPIYIQYSFGRENRRLINSGKKIEPEFWDGNTGKARKNYVHNEELNGHLARLTRRIEGIMDEIIVSNQPMTLDEVEHRFLNRCGLEKGGEKLFFDCLEEFIIKKSSQVSDVVIRDYKSLRTHLLGFQNSRGIKIAFSRIDYKFYEDFVRYLEFELIKPNGEIGLQKNTVGKVIKNLKSFLNDCMKLKVIENIDISQFRKPVVEVDDVYMTESELDSLQFLDLGQTPILQKIRDMFLLGCETGLRFSDLNRLNWDNIKGDFIRIKVQKTTSSVIIPLSERSISVLSNYSAPCFPSGVLMPDFNEKIKGIALKANITSRFSKWKIVGNKKLEVVKGKYAW